MNLTDKDIALIDEVERASSRAKVATIVVIIALAISLVAFIYGWLESVTFAYMCVGLSLMSILLPRLIGRKQSELVALLVRVRSESSTLKDPITEALSKTPGGT